MTWVPSRLASGAAVAAFALLVPAVSGSIAAQAPPAGQLPKQAEGLEFFERKVRPLLVEQCFGCHSKALRTPGGGLRLDSRAAMLKGARRGPVITPGKPDTSLLVEAVEGVDSKLTMPPGKRLPEEQVEILRQWVLMGAPWPGEAVVAGPASAGTDFRARALKHWSFRPSAPTAIPPVRTRGWVRTPVDAFILARLEKAGLTPSAEADRRTLLRRVTFNLIGMPPTPAEVEAFVNDRSPTAYEKVVDRLLASPHYGERWARHWLDLVRYAETDGHEFDFEKPNAHEYRDYVIRALNADTSYKQFVMEHVAGDLLPAWRRNPADGRNESVIATGFWSLGEGKHSPVDLLEDEAERTDNQVDVFSRAFLGLSTGCARCHDHKFDPISTRDYYALVGILKSSRYDFAAIDAPEKSQALVREITEVDRTLVPQLLQRTAAMVRAQAEQLPRTLLAARAVMGPAKASPEAAARAHNADPSVVQSMVKELEAARGNPAHPFHAWALLAGASDGEFSSARSRIAEQLRALERRSAAEWGQTVSFADFRTQGYENWFRNGDAFGEAPSRRPLPRVQANSDPPVEMIVPAGAAHTGALSPRLQGTLRSRTFRIEQPRILLTMAGSGVTVNLIIDNFQRIRYPIYGGLTFTTKAPAGDDQARTYVIEVGQWVGHRAYLEVLDFGGGWTALEQVRFGAGPTPPAAPNATVLSVLSQPGTETPAGLARGLADAVLKAAEELAASRAAGQDSRAAVSLLNAVYRSPIPASTCGAAPAEMTALLEKRRALEAGIPEPRRVMALTDGTGEDSPVYVRGSSRRLGDVVPRRFMEAISGKNQAAMGPGCGRLELARRLVDPSNALLGRVIVNRIWMHHFGEGIVRTPDDFGIRGELPTHPELLEWLTADFIRQGWSIKKLHRRILLSATYRQASDPRPRAAAVDPQNKLLHRMPVRRLEAEAIRDSLLAISGRLDARLYGPPVLPHLTEFLEGRGRPASSGPLDGDGRRSIYLGVRRNFLNPMFLAFDYPIPFNTMGRRSVSTVPAQALTMMNNPLVIQQADVWARSELARPARSAAERVARLYVAAFGRPPTADETSAALGYLREAGAEADPAAVRPWSDLCHVLFNVKEFVFVR